MLFILVAGGRLSDAPQNIQNIADALRERNSVVLLEASEPGARIVVANIDGAVLADTREGAAVCVIDNLGGADPAREAALNTVVQVGGAGKLTELVRSLR